MMFKVRQCCRAMVDQDLEGNASRERPKSTCQKQKYFLPYWLNSQPYCDFVCSALKETDHMTRVDMLHCAVCNVYISTSATSVKNHVSSMKHHHNKQVHLRPILKSVH